MNGGLSDARNTGLQYAQGEYIGCIDGDDYVDITMFEKMYTLAKNGNADMAECDYYHVYGNKLKPKIGKIYQLNNIIITARVSAWNKIYKRELLENSKITYPVGLQYEDVEYFYKLIPYLNKVGFVKEPLYYYVQRQNSICHTYNEQIMDIFCIFDNILKYYKEINLYRKYEKQLEYIYTKQILTDSFNRIIRIQNRKLKNRLLYENWQGLLDRFPNWRKNPVLQNNNSLLNIFLKSQNQFTYNFIYPKLLKLFLK
jgi:glycosyltransferase involved in cell wall biosynthesis